MVSQQRLVRTSTLEWRITTFLLVCEGFEFVCFVNKAGSSAWIWLVSNVSVVC